MTEPLKRRQKAATSVTFASLVLISGVLQALFESSEGPFRWVFLILAAFLAGLIPFTPSWREIHIWLARMRSVRWRHWLGWGLVWTLALSGTVWLGAVAVPIAADATERLKVRVLGCPNATQLTLVASPEDILTARELAVAFERDTARRRYGCPSADIQVYAETPLLVREASQGGWSPDDLRSVGPRPDLWLAGSAQQATTGSAQQATDDQTTVVGTSPIVLAVPPSLLIDPRLQELRRTETWMGLLDRARDLDWPVRRPDPGLSVSAELATAAIYISGQDLIGLGRARQLERALTPADAPPGDAIDLLCTQPEAALILTEQQMVRYNAQMALGCARPVAPDASLRGFYPTDSLTLTMTMTRLEWTDAGQDQAERAEEFVAWLGTAAGREVLNDSALRPVAGHIRDPLSERNGVLPVSPRREYPEPSVIEEVTELRANAQRPARILLALDASGSMREVVGAGGPTRFDLAKQGITGALRHIGPGDEFALWSFQGSGGPRKLTGFDSDSAAVQAALGGVAPEGGTPLNRSIVDGVAALVPADPERVTALVVLTDGEDSGSGISREQLVDSVRDKGVKVFVVATGEASCASHSITDVTELTGGRCLEVNVASLDSRLTALFGVLWGGS